MSGYVDLYLLPVPKRKLAEYRKLARLFGKVARDHGIEIYLEFAADDLHPKGVVSFSRAMKLKRGEVLVSSIVTFRSRAHRDRTLKKMFADPRMQRLMNNKPLFDMKRMMYGGFKTIVRG